MLFKRRNKPKPCNEHSHPHNESNDQDCTKYAYRMEHYRSIADQIFYTFVWDNCIAGLIGVGCGKTLEESRIDGQRLMDEWDIEKVTGASNS